MLSSASPPSPSLSLQLHSSHKPSPLITCTPLPGRAGVLCAALVPTGLCVSTLGNVVPGRCVGASLSFLSWGEVKNCVSWM